MGCMQFGKSTIAGTSKQYLVSTFPSLEANISNNTESKMVSEFVNNHRLGNPVNLEPMRRLYASVSEDRSSSVWDIPRMSTVFAGWDGNYDGLQDKSLDRNEIGMEILTAIIEHGSSVNIVTTNGRTALQMSVLAGNLEYCKVLVEKGADLFARDDSGETALSLAKRWNKNPKDLNEIIAYLETF
jgi:ankyrin repeat protein